MNSPTIRTGHGFDLHQLVEGRKLILGGVEIPHPLGLLGHSDADCLIHALADSILGGLALPDIGHHFPDNDPANQNLDSSIILQKVVSLCHEKGFYIGNVDLTLIAQRPKLAPHLAEMRKNLSRLLQISRRLYWNQSNYSRRYWILGREEGIAAHAVCLLFKT